MTKGILYGLGVGPGDPEMLTLKAVRLLREADVIAVPDKGSGEKTALNIVREFVEGKPLMLCPTPMVRDEAKLSACYDEICGRLSAELDRGRSVAFITLGDPTVYSTYMYIHQRMISRGYEAELVPGVTSFCAVAARLGQSLCEKSQRLLVVPASHKDISDCLEVDANLVFMKAGREIGALKERLREEKRLDKASMVENCGMENERVYPSFADAPEDSGYFSVVLVKGGDEEK
ncbi:MAG: precorrin-2 C(20)-methyltransferase [Candidatus Heteroscillospira sp.]|jgi:precorrin-2/cobalt-factor-2 C20-methyltransferase